MCVCVCVCLCVCVHAEVLCSTIVEWDVYEHDFTSCSVRHQAADKPSGVGVKGGQSPSLGRHGRSPSLGGHSRNPSRGHDGKEIIIGVAGEESDVSFEGKRKKNFEAGRLELERRRKSMKEQQEREAVGVARSEHVRHSDVLQSTVVSLSYCCGVLFDGVQYLIQLLTEECYSH